MQIAKYFASLSMDIDQSSIRKVDKTLKQLENKLKKFNGFGKSFGLVINPTIDQKKLEFTIRTALDVASNRTTFEISRFSVNQRNLQAALVAASGNLGVGVASPTTRTPSAEQLRRAGVRNAEFDRQQKLRSALADRRFGVQGQRLSLQEERLSSRVGRAAVAGSSAGAGLGRFGLLGPALALGAGGYGLGALNQRNQQVVSAQLQTSAVVQQAGGTAAQGADSFQYLRSEANRVGFNYLDASQDYNKLISGLTGSGVSLGASQKVFSGFAELARVNKLDKTTQNRLFRALSQVAGKGKLQSEELTGQISEALPGGTALFAQAYQDQLRAKGGKGDLTGQAAIQALLADMKKGKVTGEILTYAGARASTQANAGGALARATTASQAEQQRYQNATNDLAVIASDNGVEEGFARIFRTLNAGLEESGGLVKGLAEGFNKATKWADDLLLWPQSFVRALEGKDSLVADWLGADKTKQLQQDWKDIKQIFTDISAIKFDFLPNLQATSKEIAAILGAIAEFQRWKEAQSKPAEVGGGSDGLGTPKTYGEIEKIDPFGFGSYTNPAGIFGAAWENTKINLNNARIRGQHVYDDPNSIFYGDPQAYDDNQKAMAMDKSSENAQPLVTQQFDISINIDPVTLANMDVQAQAGDLANWFVAQVKEAETFFPVK